MPWWTDKISGIFWRCPRMQHCVSLPGERSKAWRLPHLKLCPQKSVCWCGGLWADLCLQITDSGMGYRSGGGHISGIEGFVGEEKDFIGAGEGGWVWGDVLPGLGVGKSLGAEFIDILYVVEFLPTGRRLVLRWHGNGCPGQSCKVCKVWLWWIDCLREILE